MRRPLFHSNFANQCVQLSRFVSVQLLVQVIGFASGILLVRTLSKEEYAYFTLANSMQGAMSVLADSGVGSALSAIGGKVWQDPKRLGELINTAMRVRRYLAAIAVLLIAPFLYWMLLKNNAHPLYAVLLIIGILIELDCYLRLGVLNIVLRLHSQINKLQAIALVGAGSRITITGGSLNFLNAGIGVFASTIGSVLQTLVLRNWVNDIIDSKASICTEDQNEIWRMIKLQLPNSIFFCIQGQVTVLLISLFGSSQNVAEIGALSRLSVIFSIITSVMTNIVLPKFSKCQSSDVLFKWYVKIVGSFAILSALIVSASIAFPSELLWVLGNQYSNLKEEVTVVVINSSIHSFASMLWTINASKGWMDLAYWFPPTIIATQIGLLFLCDISSVSGVVLFSTLSVVPAACINFLMTYRGLLKTRANQENDNF